MIYYCTYFATEYWVGSISYGNGKIKLGKVHDGVLTVIKNLKRKVCFFFLVRILYVHVMYIIIINNDARFYIEAIKICNQEHALKSVKKVDACCVSIRTPVWLFCSFKNIQFRTLMRDMYLLPTTGSWLLPLVCECVYFVTRKVEQSSRI